MDCAIGDVDSSNLCDLSVVEIGPAVYATDFASLDLVVEKYGQSTRHTFGEITDTDWEGTSDGFSFDDCFRVDVVATERRLVGGRRLRLARLLPDSDRTGFDIKPVVGLHHSGAATYGIGCKIQNVFAKLDLTTLCAGAFAAFLDALFDAEEEGDVGDEAEGRLREIGAQRGSSKRAPLFRGWRAARIQGA